VCLTLASLAGCAATDPAEGGMAAESLGVSSVPTWNAPAIVVQERPSFPFFHTLSLRAGQTHVAGGGTLDTCTVRNELGVVQFNEGSPGGNESFPATDASVVFTNIADFEMLVLITTFASHYRLLGGQVTFDGTSTNIPETVEPSLLYANPITDGVVHVPPGASIALDVAAHTETPVGMTATVHVRCQPRHVFDAIPAGQGGHLSYGGGAAYEVGRSLR
jgi:hypothetical protein